MIARLLLALLLVVGALPAAAMPVACHGDATMGAMAMPATPAGHAQHHAPAVAEHGCIGCAALVDWRGAPVAAPLLVPAMAPVGAPARLALGAAGSPMLRPPRAG